MKRNPITGVSNAARAYLEGLPLRENRSPLGGIQNGTSSSVMP
jgi:hypothetical protein